MVRELLCCLIQCLSCSSLVWFSRSGWSWVGIGGEEARGQCHGAGRDDAKGGGVAAERTEPRSSKRSRCAVRSIQADRMVVMEKKYEKRDSVDFTLELSILHLDCYSSQ